MPFLTSIVNWLSIKRVHQIELFKRYPYNTQQDVFRNLIEQAKETEWGKKYKYDQIETIAQFQQAVPISTYEDLKGYIDRIREGNNDVLWPGETKWFAKSSGTTNDKSKFIPVSRESLEKCHFRGARDVMAIYTNNNPETKIFKGKGLTLGGSHKIDNHQNQSYYGDLSAILIENQPFWTEFIRTPSQQVALIGKWEEKLEMIARETIKENVTSIAGVPSWNMVMLKYILEITGKKNILEVWPNLELFMHGGVSFVPYKEQFRAMLPSDEMRYLESYNASEGFFAIQDNPNSDDMLLMLDYGVFYEFIPMDEFDNPNCKAISINEVKKDLNYAMVISTNAGLWRYLIGDTVKFTSLSPHKIKITGRTKHFLNAFGEEVIIDNAEKAFHIACDQTQAQIAEYTAAPIFMSSDKKGTHEWIIEFDKEPDNFKRFSQLFDAALQDANSDYEAKRYKDITLGFPVMHMAAKGTFYKWLQKKGKLGGQNKVPRLSNSRQYIEELLQLI